MSSQNTIRVVVAHGDRNTREALTVKLRRAGCSVHVCPGAMALSREMEDHRLGRPGGGISVLVIDAALPQGGGLTGLRRIGVFAMGVPVIVMVQGAAAALEHEAFAAGATVVVTGTESAAHAVRHIIDQDQRWGGPFISTGLLLRAAAADESDVK